MRVPTAGEGETEWITGVDRPTCETEWTAGVNRSTEGGDEMGGGRLQAETLSQSLEQLG